MSNRANPRNGMALPPTDPLQSLLDSCHRNGRPAIHAPKPEKIYFDADRFRWVFKQPNALAMLESLAESPPLTLVGWRDLIDAKMRETEHD